MEWIVIDGKSTDGSREFLKNLDCKNLKWIYESDRNMYDAMNKGILLAEGNYLQFLNAGDCLLKSLKNTFLKKENTSDLIFYNISKFDVNNHKINWTLPNNFLDHLVKYPSVPHQSTFIKRDVFNTVGLYCEDFKYLGDYEFFCRLFNYKNYNPTCTFRLDTELVSFICNGVTFNYRLSLKLLKECSKIQKQYFNKTNLSIKLMYLSKYILSYFPGTLKISSFMRNFIKH